MQYEFPKRMRPVPSESKFPPEQEVDEYDADDTDA